MTSTTDAAFRTAIIVDAPIERAFSVFTAGFDTWWPRAHHILDADLAEVVLEGCVGGRWFERGVDGAECDWGRVLEWDPPSAIALSWHLNDEFKYEPDPSKASRVDVRFIAEGTRIDACRARALATRPGRRELAAPALGDLRRRRMGDTARTLRQGCRRLISRSAPTGRPMLASVGPLPGYASSDESLCDLRA